MLGLFHFPNTDISHTLLHSTLTTESDGSQLRVTFLTEAAIGTHFDSLTQNMKLPKRISSRRLLLIVGMLTVSVGILSYSTRDFRKRLLTEVDLRRMGAYHVGFNDRSDPIWISVLEPSVDSRIVEYKTIETIDLSSARLNDPTLRCMARLEQLRMIDLSKSDITDEQLHLLSASRSLEMLRLNGSPLTDAAIPGLAAIENLKMVDLSGTKVTMAGVAKLARLRPDINVRH